MTSMRAAPCEAVAGVILAGGQSSRMGGGDKGLLTLGAKTMIAHVAERLAPQVGAMAVNANGDPARFSALGLPIVADTVSGFVGPLAGVLAGLLWARALPRPPRWIATVSADAPFIPADLVARLVAAAEEAPCIPLARSRGEVHPVIGLWPLALADDLAAALAGGVRKVLRWHRRDPKKRLNFVTTEMINLPDYAHNARFSLIGQNAAIAKFVREAWDAIA